MQFDFNCAWQSGPIEIRLPAHRSTWAHLKIAVDNLVFTSNAPLFSDDENCEPRNFIAVSVFPLAEFIAANWWPLLHEPQKQENLLLDASAFNQRHWIDKYTDGFAYPTLGFFGADTSVRIIAKTSRIESANIEFPVSSGKSGAYWDGVERGAVETALLTFLTETSERLPANDDKTWLKDVIARIRHTRIDQDEAIYCRCAGLLGADPYEAGDEINAAITQTIAILGQDVAMEMFATAEAANVASRAQWLQDQTHSAIRKSREVATKVDALKRKLKVAMLPTSKPWERGYALAQQLRNLLNLTPDMPMPTVDSVTQALFDAPSTFVSNIKNLEPNSGVRGVASESRDGFGIAMHGGKFQLAATFADFLFSRDDTLFLSTSASTDRQKSNRAFAAEFLAPIEGIKDKWSMNNLTETNIDNIAKEFGISSSIVSYQVQNQAESLLR